MIERTIEVMKLKLIVHDAFIYVYQRCNMRTNK